MGLGNGTNGSGTGATPGPGATPGQPAPNVPPAGATPDPAAAGTPPAPATPPVTPPATGDDQLSEAGRRAIAAERTATKAAEDRAKALETELQQLREAGQSDAEKAITQARREAAAEERTKWTAQIRGAEVRSALRATGMTNEKTLLLAAAAPEFASLKVTDEGTVEKLAATVEQFKKDYPELFAAASPATPPTPPQGGAWGGSDGGTGTPQPASMQDAVMDRLAKSQRR
jgi:hypothetical protein